MAAKATRCRKPKLETSYAAINQELTLLAISSPSIKINTVMLKAKKITLWSKNPPSKTKLERKIKFMISLPDFNMVNNSKKRVLRENK